MTMDRSQCGNCVECLARSLNQSLNSYTRCTNLTITLVRASRMSLWILSGTSSKFGCDRKGTKKVTPLYVSRYPYAETISPKSLDSIAALHTLPRFLDLLAHMAERNLVKRHNVRLSFDLYIIFFRLSNDDGKDDDLTNNKTA
jgi:hypothetical protein